MFQSRRSPRSRQCWCTILRARLRRTICQRKTATMRKPRRARQRHKERVDQENALVVATAKAFELLEIAYYGNRGLVNKGSYEAGLADFVEGKRIDEECLEGDAKIPRVGAEIRRARAASSRAV